MKHSDEVEHLGNAAGVEKLQELIKHNAICMFCTHGNNGMDSRPMAAQEVDDEGNFWFLSARSSQKNRDINNDPHVDLLFANTGDSEFLSVAGTAEITDDKQRIEELWNPIAKAWFTKGKDDPSITVIKVVPAETYYWDTKHGRMVSLIKILTAAVTGQQTKEGVQGKIKL